MHATYHSRNDMTDAGCKIVIWTENVTRNDGSEKVSMFLEISPICDVDQSFGIAVSEVRWMRRTVVDLNH